MGSGNAPYAIIETGGKQYRVAVGDTLSIEKLPVEPGADITFDRVLMVGGDGSARVGTPLVAGATVQAQVEHSIAVRKSSSSSTSRRSGTGVAPAIASR